MDSKAFVRIERLNYVFAAVMIGAAWLFTDHQFAGGVLVGAALTCANFSILRRMVNKLLASPPDKRGGTAFIFAPKMAALMGAVALALYFLPISAAGLGVGFSVFLVSVMVESIRFFSEKPPES